MWCGHLSSQFIVCESDSLAMGCGGSKIPNNDVHVPHVERIKVEMSYDMDDSDCEPMSPAENLETTENEENEKLCLDDAKIDLLESSRDLLACDEEPVHVRRVSEAELLVNLAALHTDENLEDVSSDEDSDCLDSDDESSLDDEHPDISEEEIIEVSLKSLTLSDDDSVASKAVVRTQSTQRNMSLRSLASSQSIDNYEKVKIRDKVKHAVSSRKLSSSFNEKETPPDVKKRTFDGMLSFDSFSEGDNDEVIDIHDFMELSLVSILSFRSVALKLREDTKAFRVVLREIQFGDKNVNCQATCMYVKCKVNKIIELNSALSKFVNKNAMSFANPFLSAEKSDQLSHTLNDSVQKILRCVMRTKMNKIQVNGSDSRTAAQGLADIFRLVASFSPGNSNIELKCDVIIQKVKAFDKLPHHQEQ